MKKITLILALIAAAALVRAEEGGDKKSEGRGPRGPGMFEDLDANQDGKVTTEEFAAKQKERQDKMFGHLDKNSDGAITKEEVPQPPKDGEGRGRFMPDFAAMDKDNNGSISKDEFAAGAKERSKEFFAKLDANGDGAVTKEEAAAMREKFGGDRKGSPKGDQK